MKLRDPVQAGLRPCTPPARQVVPPISGGPSYFRWSLLFQVVPPAAINFINLRPTFFLDEL